MIMVFFKQKTAYEMRMSDWSSDVCSSDLLLRGRRLLTAKKVVEQRRRRGRGLGASGSRNGRGGVSSGALLRAYREDADKKRLLVRKADVTRDRLLFISAALTKLFADDNFVTLLRAEGLDTLPRNLAERIQAGRRSEEHTSELQSLMRI